MRLAAEMVRPTLTMFANECKHKLCNPNEIFKGNVSSSPGSLGLSPIHVAAILAKSDRIGLPTAWHYVYRKTTGLYLQIRSQERPEARSLAAIPATYQTPILR
jgi:hypothetical protein